MVDILEKVLLADYTTFDIGGHAKYFAEVHNEDDLREAILFARDNNLNYFILAGGSNILFQDDGFDGLVIYMAGQRAQILGNIVIADAGAGLSQLVMKTAEMGLRGWENMHGIPGTIGGAVRGNAGAFGTEIKDVLQKTRAMNVNTGEIRDFNNKECKFDYRDSFFKRNSDWVVLTVMIKLENDEASSAIRQCKYILDERNKRHLQNVRAAGSFFKNPIANAETVLLFENEKDVKSRGGKVPAGWLIEKCGLKGKKIGDALCSEQHSDYIINSGKAKQKDVIKLMNLIKQAVKTKFDIELEEEVTIVE